MKIIVIGAVAAGTSAATKARRNNEKSEITIYEKNKFISYSGCGMPYYLGNEIIKFEELIPRDEIFFKKKYNIDIKTEFEVIDIDKINKFVTVKDLLTNEIFNDSYEKLVIATGALPFKPNIIGIENKNVFFLRNITDIIKIKEYINNNQVKKIVVAGTGFIGFELVENLINLGIETVIVEISKKITPNLDEDMATYFEGLIKDKKITLKKECSIKTLKNIEKKVEFLYN